MSVERERFTESLSGLQTRSSETISKGFVGEHLSDSPSQLFALSGCDQQTVVGAPVLEVSAAGRENDWCAAGHGFKRGDPEAFLTGRGYEDGQRTVELA
jgi:hypothetical protein